MKVILLYSVNKGNKHDEEYFMTKEHTNRRVWPVWMFILAALFYLYEFLLRVSPNVLQGDLIRTFDLDAQTFGFYSSCYYFAYAPLQLPVGALTDKLGPRRLLTFAVLLCALSTILTAWTDNYILACVGRFFIGAGSAFGFISCIKIVNIWFSPILFPFLTGVTLTIGTLGAAMGATPLSLALNFLSWRELLFYIGLVGVLLTGLVWLFIRDHNPDLPATEENTTPNFCQSVKAVVKQPQCWLIGLYAFFVTAPTDAFGGTWGVKFLMDTHGLTRHAASVAVTMIFLGMATGSPLLGWISTKIDNRKIVMFFSSLVACVALTMIVYWPQLPALWASVLFFIFGGAGTYVLAFVMIRRFNQSNHVATAVGFVNMLSMVGSAFLTFLIGWLLDRVWQGEMSAEGVPLYVAQDYHLSLFVLPLFYALSAVLVISCLLEKKAEERHV